MGMSSFTKRFPDLAVTETRVVTLKGHLGIPDGEYGFLETYCDDPACDCRRVIINVFEANSGPKIWATINYGWESPAFYAAWMGNEKLSKKMLGVTLDPLNDQTEYSPAFLDLFKSLLTDSAYVERLKRHYELFKGGLRRKLPLLPVRRTKFKKFKKK